MTYLVPFFKVDRELAARETRTVTLFQAREGIPAGAYGLIESYCPDAACDCRRVMINVIEKERPAQVLASIGYGFDREAEDAGPYLDPLNEQCSYAGALMRLVAQVVLNDPAYVARLERHYDLVKRAGADPTHPAHDTLRQATESEGGWLSVEAMDTLLGSRTPGPAPRPTGRNDPCPCGSGKKYKHCCGRRR
jgi:hypothetical protein